MTAQCIHAFRIGFPLMIFFYVSFFKWQCKKQRIDQQAKKHQCDGSEQDRLQRMVSNCLPAVDNYTTCSKRYQQCP